MQAKPKHKKSRVEGSHLPPSVVIAAAAAAVVVAATIAVVIRDARA